MKDNLLKIIAEGQSAEMRKNPDNSHADLSNARNKVK